MPRSRRQILRRYFPTSNPKKSNADLLGGGDDLLGGMGGITELGGLQTLLIRLQSPLVGLRLGFGKDRGDVRVGAVWSLWHVQICHPWTVTATSR